MYALFDELAHAYDLHTPPRHYQHDHAFVLDIAAKLGPSCHMLDVGCGTGVLLEKAREAGIVARGIDASEGMVEVARSRVGESNVALRRMQEIDEEAAYDLVVALSWTINYCENEDELRGVLRRIRRALRPGGRMLLQVAHASPSLPFVVLVALLLRARECDDPRVVDLPSRVLAEPSLQSGVDLQAVDSERLLLPRCREPDAS